MGEYPLVELKSEVEDTLDSIENKLPQGMELVGKKYSLYSYLDSLTVKINSGWVPDIVLEEMLEARTNVEKVINLEKQFVNSNDPVTKITVEYMEW